MIILCVFTSLYYFLRHEVKGDIKRYLHSWQKTVQTIERDMRLASRLRTMTPLRARTIENLASDLLLLPIYNVAVEFACCGVRVTYGDMTARMVMEEVLELEMVIEELSGIEFPSIDCD